MSLRQKHILVTGGAGFVGSHLSDQLLELGYQVTILDNLSSGQTRNIPAAAKFIQGDVRDKDLVSALINQTDACFHLAAIASVQQCNQNWVESHSVNQSSFIGLLEAVAKRAKGVIPVVYASSAAVYGNTQQFPTSENLPLRPISVYGADKAGCELHAHVAGEKDGVPTFGIRPFNIYGPRQVASSPYSGVITIFADHLKRGQPLKIYGDGKQTRDFIHISDVITFLIKALDETSEAAPICNAATGKEISVLDVAHQLAAILGTKAQFEFRPSRTSDIYRSYADTTQAKSLLNYSAQIDTAQGLKFVTEA